MFFGDPDLAARVKESIVKQLDSFPGATLAISTLAILECRVMPLRRQDYALLRQYDEFFASSGLHQVELTRPVLDLAARIRADIGMKTPDALQAASCLSLNSPHAFLTEDIGFKKVGALNIVKPLS